MNTLDWVSVMATFTSVIGMVPQIIKTHQQKSAKELSWVMIINFVLCSLLWIVYGIMTHAKAVLITNVICVILDVILMSQMFYYGNMVSEKP